MSVCLCVCLSVCLCVCVCVYVCVHVFAEDAGDANIWHLQGASTLNQHTWHFACHAPLTGEDTRAGISEESLDFFKPFGGMLMAPWFCGRLNQSWFWARFLLCAGKQPHKLWTGPIISRDQLSIRTKQKQTKLDWDCQNKALHCCWTMSLFYKTPTSFITINVQIGSSCLKLKTRLASHTIKERCWFPVCHKSKEDNSIKSVKL